GDVAQAKVVKRAFLGRADAAGLGGVVPPLGKTRYDPLPLADQMDQIASFVAAHAGELADYLPPTFGADASTLARSLRSDHDVHAEARKQLSPAVHTLQAEKGTLYLELK